MREWHAEYVLGDGLLRADGRGHYTRELLILEEDLNMKFVRWSLGKAKKDELSVEAAREYLNSELLGKEVEPATLKEFGIHLPISASTAWRWMHACRYECECVLTLFDCVLTILYLKPEQHLPVQIHPVLLQRQAPGRDRDH